MLESEVQSAIEERDLDKLHALLEKAKHRNPTLYLEIAEELGADEDSLDCDSLAQGIIDTVTLEGRIKQKRLEFHRKGSTIEPYNRYSHLKEKAHLLCETYPNKFGKSGIQPLGKKYASPERRSVIGYIFKKVYTGNREKIKELIG